MYPCLLLSTFLRSTRWYCWNLHKKYLQDYQAVHNGSYSSTLPDAAGQ